MISDSINMKIILSGCTGLVGREVLNLCIANSSITSIVALTRDAVIADNPKVKVAFINDFWNIQEVIQDIHGAESCIWYVIMICLYFTDE